MPSPSGAMPSGPTSLAAVSAAGLLAACAAPAPMPNETTIRPAAGLIEGERLEGRRAWTLLSDIETALRRAGFDVESQGGTVVATRTLLVREGRHRVEMVDPNPDPDPLAALDGRRGDNTQPPELRTTFEPAGEFDYVEIVTTARVHVRATREGRVLGVRHEVETNPPGYLFHPEVGYGTSPVEAFWNAYNPVVLGVPRGDSGRRPALENRSQGDAGGGDTGRGDRGGSPGVGSGGR